MKPTRAFTFGIGLTMTFVLVALSTGCRTPEQFRHIEAYGFVVDDAELPFALGDYVPTVRKALKSSTGLYQFKPELVDPMVSFKGYRYMTTQCGKPNEPKKQCGLFLFFQADGRLVSIYAAHPLDTTATPQIDVNWIAGFRLPSLENRK
jgi:hypothetical protein